jgi:NAD(P)-dependent dehydrogenase (short-subunit alcohol dehydrogenase family)
MKDTTKIERRTQMGRVEDKIAIVTGGASGIGKAAAKLLVAEGATVVITDLDAEQGERVAGELAGNSGRCSFRQQDVKDEATWEELIADTLAKYGRLDILVNNAGIGGGTFFVEDTPLEAWHNCLGVNLDGVFLGVKHGVGAMKATGGSIINISSILGLVGLPMTAAYCASKGGVRLLTKAAAIECTQRKLDIRINSIHPGFIETPLVARGIELRGPQMKEMIETMQPTGQMGRPEDIAEAVLFLASDAARFMTGSEMVVDGGYTAR